MQNDITFISIEKSIKNLKDEKSLNIKEVIHRLASVNTNLLIYGETGVGKDFWANYLSHIGKYPNFLNLNCGDVPATLLESEWFGFRKGAFSGADRDHEGKWSQAEKGILFLNQIDLLSLNLQSKLLRIIERKKYFPLGSNHEREVNARFIFSTGSDIEQKVRDGLFREDLYYRISAYRILVPPLRERKKDILPLFMSFAREKELHVSLSNEGRSILSNYAWRGNIRELDNFVTGLSITKQEITDDDIFPLVKTPVDLLDSVKEREISLWQLEKEYIHYLLRKYKNKVKVAKILGIARKSLYNKLDSYTKQNSRQDSKQKPKL